MYATMADVSTPIGKQVLTDNSVPSKRLETRSMSATCRIGGNLTYIARLIVGLRENLAALHASPTNASLEKWAIFIHESMSISSRNYHSVQHVFDISNGSDDPLLIVAAYFHDVIYYHVDGCLSPLQEEYLEGVFFVEEEGSHKVKLLEGGGESAPLLDMLHGVFGFQAAQELTPMSGLNEFLSAVIAVRVFKDTLPIKLLTQIAVCIEATIPFRPENEDGSAMDRLFDRLVKTNAELGIGLTEQECVKAVQRAVDLANRDVGNFCSEDRVYFLDNTWSLLPETNEKLRHQYLYTVKEFQFAVFKMNGFFGFLKPDVVFGKFRGVPTEERFEEMMKQCRRNLEVGKKYVQAKLLSCSLLAAFAELTGGDAPMSLFMGDLPSRQHSSIRLVDKLPSPSEKCLEKCDMDVYDILVKGRQVETSFDVKESPLAAFIYGHIGDKNLNKALDRKIYPMGKEEAMDLLSAMPRMTVKTVADNMAAIAVSRRQKIKQVLESLPEEHEKVEKMDRC